MKVLLVSDDGDVLDSWPDDDLDSIGVLEAVAREVGTYTAIGEALMKQVAQLEAEEDKEA